MTIEAGKTYIRTLRATSNERDTLAFQLRVDQMLSAADLYPRGLSEAAIVCIRSFHALLPPAQQVRYGGGRLPARWEAHVRTSLKQIIQQAAHPLHGNASSSSEAVIFADRAEMLASLAIDWRTGIYTQRWWWRSLFRGANIGYMLLPAWLEMPEYIPAALSHLAVKREAVPFVRRLSTHEARSLLQSITRTFALRELQSVLSTLPIRSVTPASEAFRQPSKDSSHVQPSSPTVTSTKDVTASNGAVGAQFIAPQTFNPGPSTPPSQAPWRQWVPESTDENLPLEHQALLGIGLMLLRVPSIVRSTSFAQAVYRWHTPISAARVPARGTPTMDEGVATFATSAAVPSGRVPARGTPTMDEGVATSSVVPAVPAVPAPRVPARGTPTMDELARPTHRSMVGVPLAGTLGEDQQQAVVQSLEPTQPSLSAEQTQAEKRQNVRFQSIDLPGEESFPTQRECVQNDEKKQHAQSTRQNISFFTETSLPVDVDALTTTTTDTTTGTITDRTNAFPSQKANASNNGTDNTSGTAISVSADESSNYIDKVVGTLTSTPVSVNEGGSATDNIAETRASSQAKRHEQPLSMPTLTTGIPSPHAYDRQIETMYGGLFYLVNLGLFLDLYGDFTTPLQPGLDLPMWDFMALLGEQMLGESIYTDPIWLLLAQLAGRTTGSAETTGGNDSTEAIHTTDNNQEPPGLYFEPPDQWRVPAHWLSAFPETEGWQWSKEDGRLRVKHPAQFLLLDLPLMNNIEPVEQLKHEMQPYADFFEGNMPELDYVPPGLRPDESLLPCGQPVVRVLARPLSPALQRWLCWLMPYIYARLQRALGMEDENLSSILCRHQAFISVSVTHLRIDLVLAELPIAIRIAGLDRDPGWVPAAGRFIAFHFS